MPQLNVIISRALAGPCGKILVSDGITSADMTIKGKQGIFETASVDVRMIRKSVPAIGPAASIAKNLDEYQLLICSLVHSLPDSDQSKMHLQKYRVAIIAAFALLAANLRETRTDDIVRWNRNAQLLLEDTSDAYVKAKSNTKLQVAKHEEMFEFFGVPEDKLELALKVFYGQ